jgi:hypothetical protein
VGSKASVLQHSHSIHMLQVHLFYLRDPFCEHTASSEDTRMCREVLAVVMGVMWIHI